MSPKIGFDLPNELLPYKERIEATIKPFVEIEAKPERYLLPWKSKFGGFPYFPKEFQYPIDSKGQAMFLLAQLNFGEIPQLAPFPERGILQFYIAGGHDLFGAAFENPAQQADFRVLYFPDITEDESQLVREFSFLPMPDLLPIDRQSVLTFNLQWAALSTHDYQFEPRILNIEPNRKYELFSQYRAVYEQYERLFHSEGHKIGGYPYFTQTDPRSSKPYQGEEYVLLFQMDSDDEAGIMWGDVGVANFFISEKDLQDRDFSRVFYNWDCS